MNIRCLPPPGQGRLMLVLILLLAAPLHARAQCVTGPVLHELRFYALATEDLDELVFWDPAPEMFMRIFVDGLEVCNVDGHDGWSFEGTCPFFIEEPYDPIEIHLLLMDSDVPLDDYTVDINPGPDKHLKFVYDPKCGTVSETLPGEIPGCPAGNHLPNVAARAPR